MNKSESIIFEYLYNECKKQKEQGKIKSIGCSTMEIANALICKDLM